MEVKQVHDMFLSFNQKYFWGKLNHVKLNWSKNMTLCAGKTYYKERQGKALCSIYLSQALLSQRPPEDTVNTLLHEMIHAYLMTTKDSNHKMGHGPEFREHMTRINKLHGSKITVAHNFREEVDKFRVHVYHCDGPCSKKRPYFGVLRRAVTRPPGPTDRWWAKHSQECGGTFHKVEDPAVTSDIAHNTDSSPRASSWGSPSTPSSKDTPSPKNTLYPRYTPSTPSPKYTPSSKRMDSGIAQSGGMAGRDVGDDSNKTMGNVRKRLTYDRVKSTSETADGEDELIQKIKKRHAHTSRSVLLSEEETRMRWRGSSPERGTLVEGRVNYNYKPKSGFKFNIHKYLERYRAVREAEAGTPQKAQMSQSPQAFPETQKSTWCQSSGVSTPRRTEVTQLQHLSHSDKTNTSAGLRTGSSGQAVVPPPVTWNCGVNVLVPEHVQHSQHAEGEESSCEPLQISSHQRKEDSGIDVPDLVVCPSCGEEVQEEELSSHMNECLMPFTDDF